MRVYISGPITGHDDYVDKFLMAEQAILKTGHTPINPARLNYIMPEDATHAEYMKMCIPLMDICDMVYMLEGWRDSKGAVAELQHAIETNMDVFFEGGKI